MRTRFHRIKTLPQIKVGGRRHRNVEAVLRQEIRDQEADKWSAVLRNTQGVVLSESEQAYFRREAERRLAELERSSVPRGTLVRIK